MKKIVAGLMLCTFLVSCGGTPPFPTDDTEDTDDDATEDTDDTLTSDRVLPPGTAAPTPSSVIQRGEPSSEEDGATGNGTAENITLNADDTFTVDNLPFDGDDNTPFTRNAAIALGSGFAVYESPITVPDPSNGNPVTQLQYRAVYGISNSTDTEFAIVRTGSYVGYGFGGFVYKRNGAVTLPTSGQANWTGTAAGARDRNGRGGVEYSTADVSVNIDFEDFNEDTGGYPGTTSASVTNRRVWDLNGNDITNTVVNRINANNTSSLTAIPSITFTIAPGGLDANGEIVGTTGDSQFFDDNGDAVAYESGNYYAVIAGDDADEIVGVVVVENDAEYEDASVRDTFGFIVYRNP